MLLLGVFGLIANAQIVFDEFGSLASSLSSFAVNDRDTAISPPSKNARLLTEPGVRKMYPIR